MSWEVTAEVPSEKPGLRTLVTIRAESFTEAWLRAEGMKAEGWRVLSAPERVEFPSLFGGVTTMTRDAA